jgi:hypothetical protein
MQPHFSIIAPHPPNICNMHHLNGAFALALNQTNLIESFDNG